MSAGKHTPQAIKKAVGSLLEKMGAAQEALAEKIARKEGELELGACAKEAEVLLGKYERILPAKATLAPGSSPTPGTLPTHENPPMPGPIN